MGAARLHLVTSGQGTAAIDASPLLRPRLVTRHDRSAVDALAAWYAKRPRAKALADAMDAESVSDGQIARWCHVSRQTVRAWRLGHLEFGDERLDAMRKVGARVRIQLGIGG